MAKKKYKIEIDKSLLFEALIIPNQEVNDTHLKEIKKVFEVIMIRYYSNYNKSDFRDDLYHRCLECVFTRKKHYKQEYSAYNFYFTMFRNECGNFIRKHFKDEAPLEFDSQYFKSGKFQNELELDFDEELLVLQKYEQYLSGAVDYNYIRLPRSIIIELVCTLLEVHKKSIVKAPKQFNPDALYTILNNLIN